MDSFADLKILSQEDQSAHALLGKIYSALHLELVEQQLDDIGVSFPNARQIAMGDVLRLHGSRKKLADLLDTRRLKRLLDYYSVASINPYPDGHAWKHVKRVQPKITAAKARRMVKRGSASEERAQELYDRGLAQLKIPYLNMYSGSTAQPYRLYICQTPCDPPIKAQSFSSFGLGACVPWF